MITTPLFGPRVLGAVALVSFAALVIQTAEGPQDVRRGWQAEWADGSVSMMPSASFVVGMESAGGTQFTLRATVIPPSPGLYRFEAQGENAAFHVRTTGGERSGYEVQLGSAELNAAPQELMLESSAATHSDGRPFELTVTWTTLHGGPARGRLLWAREFDELGGFPLEPVPTSALIESELSAAPTRVQLEGLLEKKGCVNCHEEPRGAALGRTAPKLDLVRQRAGSEWLRDWIAAPHSKRAGADMPQVLVGSDEQITEEATALARFLESLSDAPDPSSPAVEAVVLQRGRDLYHAVGCVACHGALVSPAELLDDEYSSNELPAGPFVAPFGGLAGKWRPAALSAFLQDPLATHPDGRMPSMNLNAEEGDSIANYLADHFGAARDLEGDGTEQQVALGQKLFVARRCSSCHTLESRKLPKAPVPGTLFDRDGDRGGSEACLAELGGGSNARAPRYDLDADTRHALGAFLSQQPGPEAHFPHHAVALTLERHACRVCHVVDGVGGPADDAKVYFWTTKEETDLGDEGRFPPDLSGVGNKLTTSWTRQVLMDGGTARPYMATRMPQFGRAHMDGLAELFAEQEGVVPDTDLPAPEATDELVMTGRALMGLDKLACVNCHVYKDYPPLSTEGPDMTAFAERLRYEWWRSYVHNPARYKLGTRMPSFGTGNVSSFKDVLGGDLTRQGDALWAYMNMGDFMPVPEGIERESEMIIPVGDRPVVVRAFLPEVGARGIAVGNPNGVHFAFDAEAVRLVHAWRGEFLDASGSWAGRGGSVNEERGEIVWAAEPGPSIWFGPPLDSWPTTEDAKERFKYRGYRIERDGSPTFLYEFDSLRIEERVSTIVLDKRMLERTLAVHGLAADAFVHVRLIDRDRQAALDSQQDPERVIVGTHSAVRMDLGSEDPSGTRWQTLEPILEDTEEPFIFVIMEPLESPR